VRDDCMHLPFTLIFFVVVFILVLYHFHQQTVFRLTEAVSRDLPLLQLENEYPSSLWTWLEGRTESPQVGLYNCLVGGVRVTRRPAGELQTLCSYNAWDYLGNIAKGDISPKRCNDGPLTADTEWLLWPLQQQEVVNTSARVRDWWQLGPQARSSAANRTAVPLSGPTEVHVGMVAYNSGLKYYILYGLSYRVSDTGSATMERTATAFDAAPLWLSTSKDWDRGNEQRFIMVLDVLFLAMYLTMLIFQTGRLLLSLRCRSCKVFFSYCTVWNAIDWAMIVLSVIVTVLYFYSNQLTWGLVQLGGELPTLETTRKYGSAEFDVVLQGSYQMSRLRYLHQLNAVLEQAALLLNCQGGLHWCTVLLGWFSSLRFFRVFRASPRLNMLFRTLQRAAVDLAHFFLVFAVIFLGFAIIGHAIFGRQLHSFNNVGESVHTSFLFLWGFTFDDYKDQLVVAGGTLAVIWALAFNAVVVLLLLNVVVAIILDVYIELRRDSKEDLPSIARQLWASRPSCRKTNPELEGDALIKALNSVDAHNNYPLLAAKLEQPERRWWRRVWADGFETRVLRVLEQAEEGASSDGHEMLLRVEDVCTDALPWLQRQQLKNVFAQAAERGYREEPPISTRDAVGVCNRVDCEVAALEPLSRDLMAQARSWAVGREDLMLALATAIRSPQRTAVALEGNIGAKEVEAPSNILQQDEHAASEKDMSSETAKLGPQQVRPVSAAGSDTARSKSGTGSAASPRYLLREDSPEPEPHGSTILALGPLQRQQEELEQLHLERVQNQQQQLRLYTMMEERMTQASSSQEKRYQRLEDSIASLARRLEPMLHGGSQDVMVDPQRIERLEEKVKSLMLTLAPVMDMDGPLQMPKKEDKKMRPPTPPRALMNPAPARVPRARGSTPAMWSRTATPVP